MKAIKLLFGFVIIGLLASSCYTEVFVEDEYIEEPVFNVNRALQTYDLWYVDINATVGNGEVPFLQRAFTISFDGGTVYANNNIAGIGSNGNGFGVDIGYYSTSDGMVRIDHDVDGIWDLQVYSVNGNTLELYSRSTDTSYYVEGYNTNNFDYDRVFYENIQYFLQEYELWEKVYVSNEGAINDFDAENFIQFLAGTSSDYFRSSIDEMGTPLNKVAWDNEGDYQVYDVKGDETFKTLTLDYDYMGNDYFELYVLNDNTIELFHSSSGTTYQFKGRYYIEYLKAGKQGSQTDKKRTKTTLPKMDVVKKRT